MRLVPDIPLEDHVSIPSEREGIQRWIRSGVLVPQLEQDRQGGAPRQAKPISTD